MLLIVVCVILLIGVIVLGFCLASYKLKLSKLSYALQAQEDKYQNQEKYYQQRLLDEEAKLTSFKQELANTETIKKNLKLEFENLSQKILEHKAQDFQHSQTKTLAPLQKDIQDFKNAFEMLKNNQIKESSGLRTEIKLLRDLNETISKEAANLTKALKGESKTRGNWGEMILESMLEKNGFIEGQNYHKQVQLTDENSNRRLQPDIIVALPDKRNVVIDSKLNLIAYDALSAAETKEEAEKHLKTLINHMDAHAKELGEKKYHLLTQEASLDFTIMFVPIEGAFIEAMRADTELFNRAYERRVVITSPSTLMSILMTIHNLWKNEQTDKDYRNIIGRLDKLKDKITTFCGYMNDIGSGISTLQQRYDKANKTLQEGRGNIKHQIQTIKNISTDTQDLLESSDPTT
ncbi:hypothetical protein BKH46_03545 [Helicobacter sp. 12S02634-8]|nr:hypothetical protein BKH46_03545 [Helicobacter sp. 12S02634-8]